MNAQVLIREAAALLAGLDPAMLSDVDVLEGLPLLRTLCQAATARQMAFLREAEERKLPSSHGAAHPVPWTANMLKVSRATVRRLRKLGRSLTAVPLIADAFNAGQITSEQAQAMADALTVLPAGSERLVLERGAELCPDELAGVLRDLQEELDPFGTQQRDEDAAARAEERDWPRRRITLSREDGSNLVRIQGYLDVTAAAPFLAAIDALCAPRNHSALGLAVPEGQGHGQGQGLGHGDGAAGAAVTGSGSAGSGSGSAGSGPVDASDGTWSPLGEPDLRTGAQRRHDAICEIGNRIQAAGTLPDHGGDRPQVVVTVAHETLVDGLSGLGRLDDGTLLTPATCRLMACDATILPVVMDGGSLPLDLGRTRRHFNAAIRRALRIRDRGCSFPSCDRTAPWTEAHHCVEWSHGGPTDLGNAALVCHFHHRLLHHSDWRVRINPADGRPEYFAPGDPVPRRNHYHR